MDVAATRDKLAQQFPQPMWSLVEPHSVKTFVDKTTLQIIEDAVCACFPPSQEASAKAPGWCNTHTHTHTNTACRV